MSTVDALLGNPFINLTREQKEKIVLAGKPRPPLEKLTSVDSKSFSDQENKFVIVFDIASYDHVEWMTGCEIRQALFCWPCLLFGEFMSRSYPWNSLTGVTDLTNLREKIATHESWIVHIQSVLDYQLFSSQIAVETAPTPNQSLCELVDKNREIAKRIIDVICYLVTQQKHPRNEARGKNALEIEDCLENLSFLRDYDILKVSSIDDAIEMIQVTPKIVPDMIEAINCVMKRAVEADLHQSPFASLILSEHSTEPSKSQISTVLRYLKNGEVCERFVGFSNRAKSTNMVLEHVHKIITDFYKISQKLVAVSCDGMLTSSSSATAAKFLSFNQPNLHFVPCHFHSLDDVLQKCLTGIPECDYFFKNMAVLESYFKTERSIWQFQNYTGEIPNVDSFQSGSYVGFLSSVNTHRQQLITFFNHIVNSNENVTQADMVRINGIRSFLIDYKTVFLVAALIKLFDIVAPLVEIFKGPVPAMDLDPGLIKNVIDSFDDEIEKEEIYSSFLNNVASNTKETDSSISSSHPVTRSSSAKLAGEIPKWVSKKSSLIKLYTEIMQCMKNEIRYRFECADKLKFCRILDLENTNNLTTECMQILRTSYNVIVDHVLLEKEIKLVVVNKLAMNSESVHELYAFFAKSGLGKSFSNLNKLCELVLVLPCTAPRTQKELMTKLEMIDWWSYNPKHESNRDISFMCIEQEYLRQLMKKPNFYDDVMQMFQEKNKKLQLS